MDLAQLLETERNPECIDVFAEAHNLGQPGSPLELSKTFPKADDVGQRRLLLPCRQTTSGRRRDEIDEQSERIGSRRISDRRCRERVPRGRRERRTTELSTKTRPVNSRPCRP